MGLDTNPTIVGIRQQTAHFNWSTAGEHLCRFHSFAVHMTSGDGGEC